MQDLFQSLIRRLKPKRYRGYTYPQMAKALYYSKKVKSRLPLEEIDRLKAEFTDDEFIYTKYLDYEEWIAVTMLRAIRLDLDSSKALSVLDIGTGAGYFPWICQYFGHQAVSIDIDNHPVFNSLVRVLGVERLNFRVEKNLPVMDFGRRFDLITAFMANFNRGIRDVPPWDGAAWRFFLKHLATDQMNETGRIVMTLNRHYDGEYFSSEVKSCFKELGATIDRRWVTFPDMAVLRSQEV